MEEKIEFEKELARLNEIVGKVESGVLPLEESIALFEEGQTIIQKLKNALEEAKETISKYTEIRK